jgi:hypothetical protein
MRAIGHSTNKSLDSGSSRYQFMVFTVCCYAVVLVDVVDGGRYLRCFGLSPLALSVVGSAGTSLDNKSGASDELCYRRPDSLAWPLSSNNLGRSVDGR